MGRRRRRTVWTPRCREVETGRQNGECADTTRSRRRPTHQQSTNSTSRPNKRAGRYDSLERRGRWRRESRVRSMAAAVVERSGERSPESWTSNDDGDVMIVMLPLRRG
jgi:hypothetical protein